MDDYIEECFSRVAKSSVIVLDTETNGLDWRENHIVGYVFSVGPDPSDQYYLPVRHKSGPNYDPGQIAARIRDEVASRTNLRVIFHNASFDLHMLANEGINLSAEIHDTMINAALIDENVGKYSLDACAQRSGVQAKKGDELYTRIAEIVGCKADRNSMAHYWELPGDDPVAIEYATGDGITTYQLWQHQQSLLAAQELQTVHKVECDLIPVLHRMERRGVAISEKRLDEVVGIVDDRLITARAVLGDLNVRSSVQVRKLMETAGHTDWPLTDKGNPSFTEPWLSTFELGQSILVIRKLSNLQNSFLGPMKERHMYHGRVHATFNQLKQDDYGTVTGRLSSSSPNMQQVPKRDYDLGSLFRSIFIPDDGMTICEADYSQCEFRLFAFYSQSKVLKEGYRADPPVDIHTQVATMLGVDRDPTAKRMNMGLMVGMGAKALAGHLGITVDEGSRWHSEYHEKMPEAKIFAKRAEQAARQRGWVKTLIGRRRHFPDPNFTYKAGNAIIQGANADIIKIKMVEVDQYLNSVGGSLLLSIHDSLVFQYPDGRDDIREGVVRIMGDVGPDSLMPLDVPMVVDFKYGKDWNIATYGV